MPVSLRRALLLLLMLLAAIANSRLAIAHPMGNFSINHYSRIELQRDGINIQYILDLAEIPTYQELQDGNISTTADSRAIDSYLERKGAELARGLSLSLNGKTLPMRLVSSSVIFPPGAGGLPTMKMGFTFHAECHAEDDLAFVDAAGARLTFADQNYPGHSGWKEIIAVAAYGSLIGSSVPAVDRSNRLSNYPTDLLNSPPQVLNASMNLVLPHPLAAVSPRVASVESAAHEMTRQVPNLAAAGSGHARGFEIKRLEPNRIETARPSALLQARQAAPTLNANQKQTPRDRFTELIATQQLGGWFLFTAAFIAAGLGGLHALEPGHGKTILAAYLVGSRGTARHAIQLGLIVTVSHTAGVFALGAVTLYASRYIVPEQLYPWLGFLSGVTIAVLGFYMLLRRLTGTEIEHSHASGDGHDHFSFLRLGSDKGPGPVSPGINNAGTESVSLCQLFTLGITGGIIPCPAALIVLLGAFALHRIALGFFLIFAFSLGLATVLIGFGMAMVFARSFLSRFQSDGPLTQRWLPLFSSTCITVLGCIVAARAFVTTTVGMPLWANLHWFSKEKLGPFLFVTGLGLILGMRHSTDADHVVAISTIVSRQRSIRGAAMIGSVWGLGHTITIFIVGSLIILFSVEIPVRVGLSMEFSVAVMLVVLGLLNLSGLMQKISNIFARTPQAVRGGNDDSPVLKPRGWINNNIQSLGLYQCLRPLIIGLMHGLAGSAAVALLVLSTIHDPIWATLYLLIFGAGTVIGMMCMTAAMAVPLAYAGNRFGKVGHYLSAASGLVSVCFGSFLIYQLGFLGGLFTNHPEWTPR